MQSLLLEDFLQEKCYYSHAMLQDHKVKNSLTKKNVFAENNSEMEIAASNFCSQKTLLLTVAPSAQVFHFSDE